MIKFVAGDFFDYEADIRINTVNCVGVMGAGVALIFKNKYPKMFKDYALACKKKQVQPGVPHIWLENDMFKKLTIINFPTKIHWRNPSEYEYIEKGLNWFAGYLSNQEKSIITLPALGCGHGGLDWDIVKNMIIKFLDGLNHTILVFEPKSSTNRKIPKEITEELTNNNILKLLPNDKNFPKKLKGKSSLEIYYKGNLSLLSKKNISIYVNSKPSDREINALAKFIDELSLNNFVFLLGYSHSYEIDLVKNILSKGFPVIVVLSSGILQLKIRKDLKHLWDYKKMLVLSTLPPRQTWRSYESINALKFRLKITNLVLINSLQYDKFKIFEKDFKDFDKDKFYINYWSEPKKFFDSILALKIGLNSKTKRPNVSKLIQALNST